jgi:diguanylate cyclase (GGDEF)-like protein
MPSATAGDQLLSELGRRLKASVGENEMVARFGGDEFVAFKLIRHQRQLSDFITRLQRVR